MKSIVKSSAITFTSQILIFLLGFIISIILARVLGPTGRGIYALIILVPTIMLRLGSLGIEAANVYFTGSEKYNIKDIVSNSIISALSLGFILLLLTYGMLFVRKFHDFIISNQVNPYYFCMVVLTIPFSLLFIFFRNIFLGKEEIVNYNKINIFRDILQLLAIIVLLLILKQSVFGAVLSYVFAVITVTFILIYLIKKLVGEIRISLNKELIRDSVKYGLKCYFGNLVQFLNYRLDLFLVAVFLFPAAVGYYTIAVGIAERLWMFPAAIATVLFPRISSLKDREASNLTVRISRHAFFIIFIFSLILALLAKPLIKVLFGSNFLPSVSPFLILLPGIIALGGAKTLTADLAGRGKPQFGTYASLISFAINIPLNLYLIPKWGISGAAFASSIAYIIATIIVVIAFINISGKSLFDIVLIKKQDFQDYKNFFGRLK